MPVVARLFSGSRRRRWVSAFGFWTAVGLFFSLQSLVSYAANGSEVHVGATLVFRMSHWYAWGLLAPLIFRLARRVPLDRQRWRRGMPVHVAAAAGIVVLQMGLSTALRLGGFLLSGTLAPGDMASYLTRSAGQMPAGSFDGVVTYVLLLGLFHLFEYHRKYRERELRASKLEGQLAQAQLTALKMQLHPHFLFNTLHGISALVSEDPNAAERMIARLSDLLRLTLENAGTQEVPLRQELAFLERYLEIEQIRFQDRLIVTVDIAPDVRDARVPNLVLQPLVENAIRHGIAPRTTPGRVEITAGRTGERLCLSVRDDGPGLPAGDGRTAEGVGLANTRARLNRLYGPAHRLELHTPTGGGFEVRLTFPLQIP